MFLGDVIEEQSTGTVLKMRSLACGPDYDLTVASHRSIFIVPLMISLFVSLAAIAEEPSAEHLEFFETKVRPLLVDQCFQCHSEHSKPIKAGLQLGSRVAALRGGESGAAIVPRGLPQSATSIC